MAGTIYTPVTLWEDFILDLPLEETSEEYEKDGLIYRKTKITGKRTASGRVSIYSLAAYDKKNKKMPAVFILPNYTKGVDEDTVTLFARKGYYAFMIDYAGNGNDGERTEYPEELNFAHYVENDTKIHRIDDDAKKSCWYEWCSAARYAFYYLKSIEEVSCVGAFGMKHGATVLWQLASQEKELKCAVFTFSAGWHEYRGHFKFGDNPEIEMADDTYKYLAAIDPQVYAQYVSCPSLLLTTTNNGFFDVDRAYDTVQRIEKSVETHVNYSVQCDKYLDQNSFNDVFVFLEKQLKNSKTELPHELEISCELVDGYIYIKVTPDFNGLKRLKLFASEEIVNPALRCWNLSAEKVEETQECVTYRYRPYKYSGQAFFFASAKYSSGFTVCSKIINKKFDETQSDNENKSVILFSSRENNFLWQPCVTDFTSDIVAYMRSDDSRKISIEKGPFDIEGITCPNGLRTFKINASMDKPKENSILLADVYAPDGGTLKVSLVERNGETQTVYGVSVEILGGEVWHGVSLALNKFKTDEGMIIKNLNNIYCIDFKFDGKYLLNNVLWV